MHSKLSVWVMCMATLVMLTACREDSADPLPTLAVLADATAAPTATPIVPSAAPPTTFTPTSTSTLTPSPSLTPSATITDTPIAASPTSETIATADPARPITNLLAVARSATVLPAADAPVSAPASTIATSTPSDATMPTCPVYPTGDFGTVFTSRPDLSARLGCPQSDFTLTLNAAVQNFEQGFMLWIDEQPGQIYAFFDELGSYLRYPDTFNAAVDPEIISAQPPAGLLAPARGFGKVWQANAALQDGLGYALAPETGASAEVLRFANGQMIALEGRAELLVLLRDPALSGGAWSAVAVAD